MPSTHGTHLRVLSVVTGATDGIGRAYAVELAARGFNLVLISRTAEKLERTAAEIRVEHPVKIETIAFDFTNPSIAAYEAELLPRLRELPIGVLGEWGRTRMGIPAILLYFLG